MATINARTTQLHATENKWKQRPDFIPNAGEIIIYDKDSSYNYSRIKIGDGETPLAQLMFVSDYQDTIDGGNISTYPQKELVSIEGES